MKYTDPEGEWVQFVIGALYGAYTGYKIGKAYGASGLKMFGYVAGGALVGGISSYAGFFIGTKVAASALAGGSSIMGSSIAGGFIGGMISGGINGMGTIALAGGKGMDIVGGMLNGMVVGGFSGAAGAAAFQGMNNLLNKNISFNMGGYKVQGQPLKILPTNTLSYMAGSTASQMTANIATGKNPFKGNDYGLNIGLILPLSADILRYSPRFNEHMARKTFKNKEIVSISSETNINSQGDLLYKQDIGVQDYYEDFRMEMIDLNLTGMPRPIPTKYTTSTSIFPNYKFHIFSIYNLFTLSR